MPSRRLLSAEERGGTQRIEITHDVLAPLVIESREKRKERERAEEAEAERRASEERAQAAAAQLRRTQELKQRAIDSQAFAARTTNDLAIGIAREIDQASKIPAKQSRISLGVATESNRILENAAATKMVLNIWRKRLLPSVRRWR